MFTVFTKTKIQPSRQSLIERQLVEPTDTEKSKLAKALGQDAAVLFPAATTEPASDAATA
jgi:hypothetical protein